MVFQCIIKQVKNKRNFFRQSWRKHLETFHFLAQFVFTTSEMEPHYYHQKVNIRVASRVAKWLKTYNLRKLRKFKKIPEILGLDGEYPTVHPQFEFWCVLVKSCKKSNVKHSIENPLLLNFVNLPSTFCPRLLEEPNFYFWLGPGPFILHFLKILALEKAHSFFKLIFKVTQLQKVA